MQKKYSLVILFFLNLILFNLSCTKIIYKNISSQNVDGLLSAIPDDNKDDTKSLQLALDEGALFLTSGVYIISEPLIIIRNGTILKGNGATLKYIGEGPCITSISLKPHNAYPVNCYIDHLNIEVKKAKSTGIRIRLSYSVISNLRIMLWGKDDVGVEMVGDKNGTGPYYNEIRNCNVQGRFKDNQIGVLFSYDKSYKGRCGNANAFYGGRFSQLTKGLVIRGAGNTFYSPVLEGIKERCFEFSHPESKYGSVSNDVYSAYIEGANGATVAYFGPNSTQCTVVNPYVTSIGLKGKMVVNNSESKTNKLITVGE